MSYPVDIQLLGAVQVTAGERVLALHGRRQQRLLAALALDVSQVFSIERLIDLVWSDTAGSPVTARRQVQDLVSRLRKELVLAGCPRSVLAAQGSGYVLRVPADAVDTSRFRACVAAARAVRDTDPDRAAIDFRAALRQWRGDVLAGLYCPALEADRVSLTELRWLTWEQAIELELGLGRHSDVLSELAALTELHPERERLVQLSMHALHQAGRTADALGAFHRLRRRLADGLGIDPGPALLRCYESILRGELQGSGRVH